MLRTRSDDFAMRWGLFFLAICVLAVTDGRHSDHKHKIRLQRSSSQPDARIDKIKEVLFGPEGTKVKHVSSADPNSSGGSFNPPGESSGGSFDPSNESSGGSYEPTEGPTTEPTEGPTTDSSAPDSSKSSDPEDTLPKNPLAPKLLLKAKRHASKKDKPLELT